MGGMKTSYMNGYDRQTNEFIQCTVKTKSFASGAARLSCQTCRQEEVFTSGLLAQASSVHGLPDTREDMDSWMNEEKDWFPEESLESICNNTLGANNIHPHHGHHAHAEEILGLNPQDHFDPDLDDVDDKFIDSLLNNTPPSPPAPQHLNGWMTIPNIFNNNTSNGNNGAMFDLSDFGNIPVSQQSQPPPPSIPPSLPPPPPPQPLPQQQPQIQSLHGANHHHSPRNDKKPPQFRWRRRKRRSKAQYPEMSQYLVPVDSGDEVQHLGRTLECQLCGLRGKRCHLTLHFKAKHSEVIEFEKHGKKHKGHVPPPDTNLPPPPPPPPPMSYSSHPPPALLPPMTHPTTSDYFGRRISEEEEYDLDEDRLRETEDEEDEDLINNNNMSVTNGAQEYIFNNSGSNNLVSPSPTLQEKNPGIGGSGSGKYKIVDLEEALGKAFLFLKDTLDDPLPSHPPAHPPSGINPSSQIEIACMEKMEKIKRRIVNT